MNTEPKVNEFFDAFSGALNGYTDLISLLVSNGQLHSETQTCVEFEEVPDKEFTVKCYDKLAVGLSNDGTVAVILKYPSRFDLTKEEMKECLEYRGVKHLHTAHETYYRAMTHIGDVMMRFGKVTFIHHIK